MGKKFYVIMISAMGVVISNTSLLFGQDPGSPLLQYAGNHAQLSVAKITDQSFEIVLAPLASAASDSPAGLPSSDWNYPRQLLFEGRSVMDPLHGRTGDYSIDILRSPLRVIFRDMDQQIIQQISWPESEEGKLQFLAETPLPGFDLNAGESNTDDPVLAVGEKEWAILFQHPLSPGNRYLYENGNGFFIPDPAEKELPVQLFLILWEQREEIFEEYKIITGRSALPNVWKEEVAEIN